jgi:hypothetical protein
MFCPTHVLYISAGVPCAAIIEGRRIEQVDLGSNGRGLLAVLGWWLAVRAVASVDPTVSKNICTVACVEAAMRALRVRGVVRDLRRDKRAYTSRGGNVDAIYNMSTVLFEHRFVIRHAQFFYTDSSVSRLSGNIAPKWPEANLELMNLRSKRYSTHAIGSRHAWVHLRQLCERLHRRGEHRKMVEAPEGGASQIQRVSCCSPA